MLSVGLHHLTQLGPNIAIIGTQQLNFLGNCHCRLNFLENMHTEKQGLKFVPIFDTTQMGDVLSIVGHVYPFQGLFLKHKRGIFGHRIALLTFDNYYLLGNIHWYSIAAYVNMRICETCVLILVKY